MCHPFIRIRSACHKLLRACAVVCLAAAGSHAALAADAAVPTYSLVRTIALPATASPGWDYLACDSENHRVYVAHGAEEDVIDTQSGQVVGAIKGLSRCHGVAIDDRDGRGYISNGGDANTVVVFDLATLKTMQTIPVAAGPDAIVDQTLSDRICVFSGEARVMTVLDGRTGKVLGTVSLPGTPEFAVASRNGFVYDNIVDRSEIVEVDPRSFAIGNIYPVAPGVNPTGLALDDKNNRVFSACSNQTLVAMEIDFGVILSSLPIGAGVDACAFDPGLNRIYTSNGRSGTVTVIGRLPKTDDQYTVLTSFSTLPRARTMTLDTKTHHLFVAAPSGDGLAVLEYAPAK